MPANWRYKIDIKPEHEALRRFLDSELDNIDSPGEKIDPATAGKRIAEKLRNHSAYQADADYADRLKGIASSFDAIETVEEYDEALKELYDWGDQWWPEGKFCWINTF
jgi:hypothetical protein